MATANDALRAILRPRLDESANLDETVEMIGEVFAVAMRSHLEPEIPAPVEFREICRDLLGYHGLPSGTAPGSFRSSLFHTIGAADANNRGRLIQFPGELLAVVVLETMGDDTLRKVAEAPEAEIADLVAEIIGGFPDA